MSKEFMLPELGENIESADVLHVLVKKGDVVAVDQSVIEIETDKATIEVPSSIAGVIKDVYCKDGDKVKVGQVVFSIEADSSAAVIAEEELSPVQNAEVVTETVAVAAAKTEEVSTTVGVSSILEMTLPELGENIATADILKVLVKVGDKIKNDDVVLEIETDKATIEVPSVISGIVTEVFVKEGQKATVGQVVLKAAANAVKPLVSAPAAKPIPQQPVVAKTEPVQDAPKANLPASARFTPNDFQPGILANPAPAAPSVRRIARELGIDINNVKGSGEHGRISMDDVKAYVKSLNLEARASGGFSGGVKAEPLPDFTKFGNVERKAMSNIRSKTAEHLSYCWATIPHVTQFDKADITELENFRKAFAGADGKAVKLTVTAILIKVIAAALKKFPQFNSSVDMDGKSIIYKDYFNVGIAVDTERGLIVPVIKNADKKSLTEISAELGVISEKARARKISPDDLQGGCFTISNLGGIGGTYFTPIVNSPEVAILGVSRGGYEQVYQYGGFTPRLMLPLSLSYDHRVIDGADGIRFLRWIVENLEQPLKMSIEG